MKQNVFNELVDQNIKTCVSFPYLALFIFIILFNLMILI